VSELTVETAASSRDLERAAAPVWQS
jgi:hypothetical protein